MIDFESLQLTVNNKYSFVGIEKREGILYFYLPKGFSKKIDRFSRFSKNRDLFFLFYKIFDTFKKICIDKRYLDNADEFLEKDRDGVVKSTKGSEIQDDGEDLENIFYSKLDIIGSLLYIYDEPKILSLAYRLGMSDKFDVSQIHKYLHQAVYLPNNAAYVDQMLLPKKSLQFESTDIVSMYCYLFCEIKQQLKESVSAEIASLSERFREKYLRSSDRLFDEQSYEQVLDILKDALEIIDHNTPFKDADYWQYYEAIELFLYGDLNKEEDGEIWGVSNFHSVWESMCLTYITQNIDPSYLLYLDWEYVNSNIAEKVKSSDQIIRLHSAFKFNDTFLKPDAVVFSSVTDKIKSEKIDYKLKQDNWDDGNYRTSFKGETRGKIAYIGQTTGIHTMEKMKELYRFDPQTKRIIVNNRLPRNFYSFWDVSNSFKLDSLLEMRNFNHFFFVASEKGTTKWENFVQEVLLPLDISYNNPNVTFECSTNSNVFTRSLFRGLTPKALEKLFTSFINLLSDIEDIFPNNIEIIDIKYISSNLFKDATKIEEIKNRSVRKQFVYEYLLQKYLKKRKDKFSDLTIDSSFWLPSYRPDDPNLIEDGETFMDGYIQLKNVNFAVLAENYIA